MVNKGAAPDRKLTNNGVGAKQPPSYIHVAEADSERRLSTGGIGDYWMRSVSFAGLHRLLNALAPYDSGLRPMEINRLIEKKPIVLAKHTVTPSPTTLYHYRNTLLRLNAFIRVDDRLAVNWNDPDVRNLANQLPSDSHTLSVDALDPFASLVLRNRECRTSFFDLFLPKKSDVQTFRENGTPVFWHRDPDPRVGIVFNSKNTTYGIRYNTPSTIAATLHGVRYWARDELMLIDEYIPNCGKKNILMFTIHKPVFAPKNRSAICSMARLIIRELSHQDWTVFSIIDLVEKCCLEQHFPIDLLHKAVEYLIQHFPRHVVPIKTSRAMATLASPAHLLHLHLKRYFKSTDGPYISHIRVRKDIPQSEVTFHGQ